MQSTLSEKSYLFIRRRLSSGKLNAGDRLVTRNLAKEIGVSLAPVREAINRLASEGLVEHIPRAGAFVRKPNREDLEELYILRDAVESCAAAEAAKFITEERLAELKIVLEEQRSISNALRERAPGYATLTLFNRWLDSEERFHEMLIDSSRNRLLKKVVRENRAIANVFEAQRRNPKILTTEVATETIRSKRRLIDALQKRDSEESRRLMSQQIQNGRKTVLLILCDRKSNY